MATASEPPSANDGEGEPEPRPLRHSDLDRATATIARAFAWHEPWGEWALPEPATREARLRELVRADLRDRFIDRGECWTIAGRTVSLWVPPGEPALASRRAEEDYGLYGERAAAVRAADELVASLKPPVEVWYLDTLATEPESMRRGLGARLLDHDLAVRDRAGEDSALDTHTPENVRFYERRGFYVTAEATLPDGEVPLYAMHRPARRRAIRL